MAPPSHTFLSLGKVERKIVAGEVAEVRLVLMRGDDVAQLEGGEEFVTVKLAVDPVELWSIPLG